MHLTSAIHVNNGDNSENNNDDNDDDNDKAADDNDDDDDDDDTMMMTMTMMMMATIMVMIINSIFYIWIQSQITEHNYMEVLTKLRSEENGSPTKKKMKHGNVLSLICLILS